MPFHILCNPAGETYTLADVTPEYAAEHEASGSGACVPFDPARHADWCPGDVHDGRGGFATPALTPQKKQEIHDALDATIQIIKAELRAPAAVADDPAAARIGADANVNAMVLQVALDAGAKPDTKDPEAYLRGAIDAAETHHDLPAVVRPICADRDFARRRVAEAMAAASYATIAGSK